VSNYHHLAFTPSGDRLFSAGRGREIRSWDTATGREREPLSLAGPDQGEQDGLVVILRLSDDGATLAAVSLESVQPEVRTAVTVWDVASSRRLLRRPEAFNYPFTAFWFGEIAPDAKTWAILGGKLKDVATGKDRLTLAADLWVGDLFAFPADGLLVAGSLSQPFSIPGHPRPGPGGAIEAVQVWETATGQPVARLKSGRIGYLAFAPDGRTLVTADEKAVRLWDAVTGTLLWQRQAPAPTLGTRGASFVSSLAVAPDGRTLATGMIDSTVLHWELPPPQRPAAATPLSAERLDALWADLAARDAGKVFGVIDTLAARPEESVPLLRERLKPVTVPAERIRQRIADLDSDEFARREAAAKELRDLGELAEPALRQSLAGQPSLEARRRIEALLTNPERALSPEGLRALRGLRVLAQAGTPEARQVLAALANGAPKARLTREAQSALRRLAGQH
jgi:hypothetical protein